MDRISEAFSYSRPCEKPRSKQNIRLPSTSSEFGLPQVTSTSYRSMWRSKNSDRKGRCENKNESLPELVRLRTSAFWELRRSIAENGEGLVRRMRDYERSRSRHQNYQKAKEAEKRGRKLASQRRKVYPSASDESDEDEILISSGDSNHIKWGSFLSKKAQSRDAMDVDDQIISCSPASHPKNHNSRSPRDRPCSIDIFPSQSEGEEPFSLDDEAYTDESLMDPPTNTTPSLSHSIYESSNSSLLSLTLPHSSPGPDPSLLSSGSDKALAALTLALSNGAGSVNDYSAIWNYQEQSNTDDDHDHGELWH